MSAHRRVPHEIRIEVGLEEVWRMLTTAEGLASWFGTDASIELVVGGERDVGWGPDMRIRAQIDAVEEPHLLRLTHAVDGVEVGAEEWILSHEAGTTVVRLIHSIPDPGVEDWDGYYGDHRRGWRIFLESMRHALESATVPTRRVEHRFVPVAGGRPAGWASILAGLDLPRDPRPAESVAVDGIGSMTVVIVDPPHSLLLASPDATVVCDLEGAGEDLVAYLQVAVHGEAPAGAPDRIAAHLESVVPRH